MKILTIATKAEGYFNLLEETAQKWGYDLKVLGWEEEWKGFSWKLALYVGAFKNLPPDEPVICVDGYDVIAIAPAEEMLTKFKDFNQPIIFSGQRYFPNQKWLQYLADQVMSNDLVKVINEKSADTKDYSRPCMGLLIGYAKDLYLLFQRLLEIESQKSLNDDQTLLNIYYLQNPHSIQLDIHCVLFQNLWRTRGGIYGKISSKDKNAEVEVFYDSTIKAHRTRNKTFQTTACFLHAPFNLDMSMLLEEIQLNPPSVSFEKGWSYWKYSIMHHVKRALVLYAPFVVGILVLIGLVIYFLCF